MKSDRIDLSPAYQRGPAWRPDKQGLLLDSIFRNYDLPKIYLSKGGHSDRPRYEIIDGQQRVRAILDFASEKLAVPGDILGRSQDGMIKFSGLKDAERDRFKSFLLTISIFEEATPTFKRTLFERLQLGERLNSAELRNALQSSTPRDLRAIALTHEFFSLAGIRDSRYKREDYLTHVFAYVHLIKRGELKDIKAPSLRKFVLDANHGLNKEDMLTIDDILNFFLDVVRFEQKIFQNKWSFVDSVIYCLTRRSQLSKYNPKIFAKALSNIENARKENYKRPHILLDTSSRTPNGKLLYNYINAYKAGSALKESLLSRQEYLEASISL